MLIAYSVTRNKIVSYMSWAYVNKIALGGTGSLSIWDNGTDETPSEGSVGFPSSPTNNLLGTSNALVFHIYQVSVLPFRFYSRSNSQSFIFYSRD